MPEPRLLAVYLEGNRLVCGFEGPVVHRIALSRLGIRGRPRVVWAEVDEFRSGILLMRQDGTIDDVGADLIRYDREPAYRARVPPSSPADLAARVARRLRAVRADRRLSQRAVAALAGLHAPNYARLESGRHVPSVDSLVRLAEALRVPLAELVAV